MRWMLFLFVLAAVGCGKSFQEANAIYEDEVKKLEALEAAYATAKQKATEDFKNHQKTIVLLGLSNERENDEKLKNETAQKILKLGKWLEEHPLDETLASLQEEHEPRVTDQQDRVDRAYQAKEAAK